MKIDTEFIHWGEIRVQFDFVTWLYGLYRKFKIMPLVERPRKTLSVCEMDKMMNQCWNKESLSKSYNSQSVILDMMKNNDVQVSNDKVLIPTG